MPTRTCITLITLDNSLSRCAFNVTRMRNWSTPFLLPLLRRSLIQLRTHQTRPSLPLRRQEVLGHMPHGLIRTHNHRPIHICTPTRILTPIPNPIHLHNTINSRSYCGIIPITTTPPITAAYINDTATPTQIKPRSLRMRTATAYHQIPMRSSVRCNIF